MAMSWVNCSLCSGYKIWTIILSYFNIIHNIWAMADSVLFRKGYHWNNFQFNPKTGSKTDPGRLQEEVPHLSLTVCKTQWAFFSHLLLTFFFSSLFLAFFLLWERLCLIPDGALRPDALWAHGYALPHALTPSIFPFSHPGPFWHTLIGPSWVVRLAKDTNQTLSTSFAQSVFDICLIHSPTKDTDLESHN